MRITKSRVSPAVLSAALLLAGCGGGQAGSPEVNVVPGALAAAPAPAAAPESATAPEAVETDARRLVRRAATSLAPLDLSDMRLWNWAGKWHASEWGNWMGPLPYKYDHVTRLPNGDVAMTLDAAGSPQLQGLEGTPRHASGMWEAEVTLPKLRDGVIVAPLWVYEPDSQDEIDFEYAGRKGLDVTMHSKSADGHMQHMSVRLFPGRDMSGERHRFGIKVDQAGGYAEMYFDGIRVHRWDRSTSKAFVSRPLRPFIEMWAANPNNWDFVSWVGRWTGIAEKEKMVMTVHGYGQSAS